MWMSINHSVSVTVSNQEMEGLKTTLKTKLRDPKILRYLNFRDLVLLNSCMDLKDLDTCLLEIVPLRRGMFTAVNNTQLSDFYPYFELCLECIELDSKKFDSAKFGEKVLDKINPNIAITALVNNALSQASRELSIQGPSCCFYDPFIGSSEAMRHAYQKLSALQLDRAWVVSSEAAREPFDTRGVDGLYTTCSSAVSVSRHSESVRKFDKFLGMKFLRSWFQTDRQANNVFFENVMSWLEGTEGTLDRDTILWLSTDPTRNRELSQLRQSKIFEPIMEGAFERKNFDFLTIINQLRLSRFEDKCFIVVQDDYRLVHIWCAVHL